MKTFDIETFNENKNRLNEYNFILKDETKINQWIGGAEEYIEIIKPKNSYFETQNRYYLSGKLKSTVQRFPNSFLAGVMKEYDEQGNLIKETDYDKPFKFTWEDILKYIKQRKFNMSAYGFQVTRNADDDPIWALTWNKSEEEMKLGVVILDGATGEIIKEYEEDYPLEE